MHNFISLTDATVVNKLHFSFLEHVTEQETKENQIETCNQLS